MGEKISKELISGVNRAIGAFDRTIRELKLQRDALHSLLPQKTSRRKSQLKLPPEEAFKYCQRHGIDIFKWDEIKDRKSVQKELEQIRLEKKKKR